MQIHVKSVRTSEQKVIICSALAEHLEQTNIEFRGDF